MKHQISVSKLALVSLATSAVLLPHLARAEQGWARTQLWQAPVLTSVSLGIGDGSEELKSSCDLFETIVKNSAKGSLKTRKSQFELQRKMNPKGSLPSKSFSQDLETGLPSDGRVMDDASREALARKADEVGRSEDRVQFTQAAETQYVEVSSLAIAEIVSADGSLTKTAEELGLTASTAQIVETSSGVSLVVQGKDLACDLIRGRAKISATGTSFARLSMDKQVQLKSFYARVSEIAMGTIGKFQKPTQRAALLGYRLGGFFASLPGVSQERGESALLTAIDAYFDASSLEPNGLWTSAGGQKFLSPRGISDAFKIKVTFSRGSGN